MSHSRIQVPQDTDSQCSKRVRDLSVGRKFLRREEVDDVTDTGDSQHDWYLLPFGLINDTEAESEGGNEEEAIVLIHLVGAGGRRGSVGVHKTVDSGADCDAETEEQ